MGKLVGKARRIARCQEKIIKARSLPRCQSPGTLGHDPSSNPACQPSETAQTRKSPGGDHAPTALFIFCHRNLRGTGTAPFYFCYEAGRSARSVSH
ncbi:hypothetical protein V474_03395 [Novosphingobium barchaimii LL02]|uniref:Uncharacterized protein n=1 Tax=Novosphingobium barchaimii LL02 TaxID=1114963 RepID=A0A0J7XJ58_9SPHN|nr:hypothetical protein V474_03395 [Novosphingobium barchaimii LL02]